MNTNYITSAQFAAIYEKYLVIKNKLADKFNKNSFYSVSLETRNTDYEFEGNKALAKDGFSISISVAKFIYNENDEMKYHDSVFSSYFYSYANEEERKESYDCFMKRIDDFIEKNDLMK